MRTLLLVALGLGLLACAPRPLDRDLAFGGSRADKGSIDDVPVKGSDVTVFLAGGNRLVGELIAVSDTHVFVLDEFEVTGVPFQKVDRVVVILDSRRTLLAALTVWGAIGTVSTLSHGVGLIISAPTWAVMSTTSASTVGVPMQTEATGGQYARLAAYARFPQGLPMTVKRTLQ